MVSLLVCLLLPSFTPAPLCYPDLNDTTWAYNIGDARATITLYKGGACEGTTPRGAAYFRYYGTWRYEDGTLVVTWRNAGGSKETFRIMTAAPRTGSQPGRMTAIWHLNQRTKRLTLTQLDGPPPRHVPD